MQPRALASQPSVQIRLVEPGDAEAIVQLRCESLREELAPWFDMCGLPSRLTVGARLRRRAAAAWRRSWRPFDRSSAHDTPAGEDNAAEKAKWPGGTVEEWMYIAVDTSEKALEDCTAMRGVPADAQYRMTGWSRRVRDGVLVGFCDYAIDASADSPLASATWRGLRDGVDVTLPPADAGDPTAEDISPEAAEAAAGPTSAKTLARRAVMNGCMDWARWRNLGGPKPSSDIVRTHIEPAVLSPEQASCYPDLATDPAAPASQIEPPEPAVSCDSFIYLHILCVSVAAQGLGIGGHFLRHLSDISRRLTDFTQPREAVPVYLESSRAGVPVYNRRGFTTLPHSCHVRDPENDGRLIVTLPCMLWRPISGSTSLANGDCAAPLN